MARLFEPWTVNGIRFRNRIYVSPMCQYLTPDGIARDWHMVHLGSRAVGKAGLVMVEASSVSLEGRITPGDSEIWMEEQAGAMLPFVSFVKPQGATPGIQFANVGRKV